MQHPASSQLLIPNLGATSQSLTCLNSTSHFVLSALCFPASLFQFIPNPCCSSPFNPLLHPDPNAQLWDVSSFPMVFIQPWKCSKARLALLCPWHCSQVKQLPGNPCSSCSAPRHRMFTLVWSGAFGEFACQTQVVSPQVSHNVPAKYQGLTRISPDFLRIVWMFFSLRANIKPEAGIQLRNFSQNKSGSAGIWSCGPIMENVWHLQQVVLLPVPPQCPVWDRNSVWPQDYLGLTSLFPQPSPRGSGFWTKHTSDTTYSKYKPGIQWLLSLLGAWEV